MDWLWNMKEKSQKVLFILIENMEGRCINLPAEALKQKVWWWCEAQVAGNQ